MLVPSQLPIKLWIISTSLSLTYSEEYKTKFQRPNKVSETNIDHVDNSKKH